MSGFFGETGGFEETDEIEGARYLGGWDLDFDGETDVRVWLAAGEADGAEVRAAEFAEVSPGAPDDVLRRSLDAAVEALSGTPGTVSGDTLAEMLEQARARCAVLTAPLSVDGAAACLLDGGQALLIVDRLDWLGFCGKEAPPVLAAGATPLRVSACGSDFMRVEDAVGGTPESVLLRSGDLDALSGLLIELYK
jgi:hypothetical protein